MNRIVVVSNRVQVPTDTAPKAGGLAVALDGLMTQRGGLWFGWSGQVNDDLRRVVTTKTVGPMQFATMDLTTEEHDRYYNEFSNGTLWPLLHSMPEHMIFDRRAAQVYRQTNARMTEVLVPLLRPTDVIWIHDYHLMAMPALLRARGIDAPIGFFLHVPFPSPDMLASVPEAGTLIRDLLSADLLGFQTSNDLENFVAAAHTLVGATRLSTFGLQLGARRVCLGVFPVEIDANEFAGQARTAWHSNATERLRRSLQGQRLILGIDRLDPTKGLIQRLVGYRRLLETRPDWRRNVTFLQIAAESRTDVDAYKDLRVELDSEAGCHQQRMGRARLDTGPADRPRWQPRCGGRLHARGWRGACDPAAGWHEPGGERIYRGTGPAGPRRACSQQVCGRRTPTRHGVAGEPARPGRVGRGDGSRADHALGRAARAVADRLGGHRGRYTRGLGPFLHILPAPRQWDGGSAAGRGALYSHNLACFADGRSGRPRSRAAELRSALAMRRA